MPLVWLWQRRWKASFAALTWLFRNSNDGISLVQTAESGMSEISNMVIRMRELSVQMLTAFILTVTVLMHNWKLKLS